MSDHDDAQDYTANGPTDIGFRTGGDGTGITNGVVATGTNNGVQGISVGTVGSSSGGYGVMGTNLSSWPGVFGQSLGVEGVGVLGAGDGIGVQGTSVNGRGVFGYGKTGVYGEGHGDQQSVGIFGTSGDGTGVFGNSDRAIGVNGYSHAGVGVHGRSEGSYGGVFTSNFAQIRLEPAALTFGPPTGPHVKGEFFVDARGSLFYCYGGSPASWTKLAGPSWLKDKVSALFDTVRAFLRP